MAWVYCLQFYDSKNIASYVAMCMRDDFLIRGEEMKVQIVPIGKGKEVRYFIRYRQKEVV